MYCHISHIIITGKLHGLNCFPTYVLTRVWASSITGVSIAEFLVYLALSKTVAKVGVVRQ